MSERRGQQSGSAGRSRARKTAASSQGSRKTGGSGVRSGNTRNSSAYRAKKPAARRRREPEFDFKKIAAGGVILIAAVACIGFLMKQMGDGPKTEEHLTTEASTELQNEVTVDGINITGMTLEEARAALLSHYSWDMTVSCDGDVYPVTNLLEQQLDGILAEIYSGAPQESYSLELSGIEEAAAKEAKAAASRWDKAAKNGSISSYDADSDKFLFSGAENGRAVNQEKLAAEIADALRRKEFDAKLTAETSVVEPEFSEETARERYQTLSTFTTKTTANSKRNTNVRLSAEAINGTILQPGEEFSFNETVGERTEAKGYKGAAAYNNGEVVEEIGGGVCQTSSTLYNAVVRSGLKTTVRRSHTFEPSYVRPGFDATVSWNGPDYKFVNNSSAAIGIRAKYADQTVTISIYGIPILEDGVKYDLESTKLKDTGYPAPTYEEDPTLAPGEEKVKSAGSQGSQWETRLVITKNGEVVSREVDHTTTYKGHAPVILRNTTGTMAETTLGEGESAILPSESGPAPEGAGDGFLAPDETLKASDETDTSTAETGKGPGADEPTASSGQAPTASVPAPTAAAPPISDNSSGPSGAGDQVPVVAPPPGNG